ncbi:MAG: glycosyltransferase [Patescibacteria group bacterium]
MKVAIVYDRINKIGGAERILVNLHAIWPDAPFYTSVYEANRARWASGYTVVSSFLQNIPFARTHHELLPWAMPIVFENFSFDAFDMVISVTSAEAKSIITKPETLHLCYCLTPTRYLWSGVKEYTISSSVFSYFVSWCLRIGLSYFQKLDIRASFRPDVFIAISSLVKKRIELYYHKKVLSVIYPPIDDIFFQKPLLPLLKNGYFLIVSRLVGYKRIDIVIEACNRLGRKLMVIGDGREKENLRKIAGGTIEFIDTYLTDAALVSYYQGCSAFLFAGIEDFGLVAAEAQAVGKPVIAYSKSGVAEIVLDGKTGIVFHEQSVQSLMGAIRLFDTMNFSSTTCRDNAKKFRSSIFRKKFLSTVEDVYNTHMKKTRGGDAP